MMAPGCAGIVVTDIVVVRAAPVPQALFAVTVTVPPDEPTVAVTVLVVELPDHPDGNDQVYEVAPGTSAIL